MPSVRKERQNGLLASRPVETPAAYALRQPIWAFRWGQGLVTSTGDWRVTGGQVSYGRVNDAPSGIKKILVVFS